LKSTDTDPFDALAAILSGALMLEYLADKADERSLRDAAGLINDAVNRGFAENRIRPVEFGGDMGTRAITEELLGLI
jgi:3-isopropylmalate dehydrogenase